MSLEEIKERMRKENPAMYQKWYGNREPSPPALTDAPVKQPDKLISAPVVSSTKSSGPSSSFYMAAVASRNKKQDPEDKAISYYINDPVEEESIKVKALKKVADIADWLDNFNRAGYATVGKLRADVQTFKKMNTPEYQEKYEKMGFFGRLKENLSIEKDKVSMAWDGLTREERHTSRDLLRDISPELVKEAEEKTKFSVLGLDMDALSVPLFAADILLDPITYIPFGAPLKVVQYVGRMTGKGMKKAAAKVVGEAAVEAASKHTTEAMVKYIYPKTNLKAVFKNAKKADGTIEDLSDIAESTMRLPEVSDAKSVATYKKVYGKGENKDGPLSWLFKTEKMVDEVKDHVEIHKMAAKIEDLGIDHWDDFKAKEMGIAVDDVTKLEEVNSMLAARSMAQTSSEAAKLDKSLVDYVNTLSGTTKAAVKQRLAQDLATKELANKISGITRDVNIDIAKFDLKRNTELYKASEKAISDEMFKIQQNLRSGIKMTGGMLAKDVQDTISMTRDLGVLAQKAFKGEAADAATAMKASIDLLKGKIASLSKYQIDATKVIGKAPHLATQTASKNVPISRISTVVRQLESDVARMQTGLVRDGGKEIMTRFNASVATISKELKLFQKESIAGLASIKGNVKATQQLNDEIVKSTTERLSELMKFQKEVKKEFKKALINKHVTVKKVTEKAQRDAKKLHAAFTSIGSKKFMKQTMVKYQSERAAFLEKSIRTEVPEQYQKHVRELFKAYDDFRIRATDMEEPFMTRQNPFYGAPREVEEKFLEKVFGTKNPGRLQRPSSGHLKGRTFKYSKEFKDWVVKNGGEVNEDSGRVLLSYFRTNELKLGMHQAKQAIMARLGHDSWDDVPGNIKKIMDDWSSTGMKLHFNNEAGQMAFNAYNWLLNSAKTMLTVAFNPAYIGRNFLTMMMQIPRVTGLSSIFNPKNYVDSFLIKAGHKGHFIVKKGPKAGQKIFFDDIRKFTDESGHLMSSRVRGDIKWSDNQILGRYKWSKDPMKKFIAKALKFGGDTDDYGRIMGAVAGMKNGMGMQEAFDASRKAMGDYNLLNSPADRMMQALLGFYTFDRRNIEREVINALTDPKQYKILSSVIGKATNREDLTDEEWAAVNEWDRGLVKFFGEAVEGVREYTTLGFFPQENAYATVKILSSGDFRQGMYKKINPVVGTMFDMLYSKDLSFTGKDFGYSLPPKYTPLIPKAAREALGLTLREAPKYEAGVIVGTQDVLYGDPDTIGWIKEFPLWSRQFNDIATLVDNIKKKQVGRGAAKYLAGFSTKETSIAQGKFNNDRKVKDAKREAAKAKGMPVMKEKGFIPAEEKKRAKAKLRLQTFEEDDED